MNNNTLADDMKSRTILIGLNEINFDFLKAYIDKGHLKHFAALLSDSKVIQTTSEDKYELLEPWIQWVTIYTGRSYDEHNIFRLGDIMEHPKLPQLFEEIEDQGLTVAAVSPFNADNRLKKSSFFIPDPWTKTKTSGGWFVKNLYKAIHQSVNDNASEKVSLTSLITLAMAFVFYVPITSWGEYLGNILKRKKPGIKAIVLDSLLIDVFTKLWKKHTPDFSHLFLNSGAHIQHHYLFNSDAYNGKLSNPEWYCPKGWDPLLRILTVYDKLLGKLSQLDNVKIIIATGLHQQAHNELTFYWRLNDHKVFLAAAGVQDYTQVLPRMSRDFLINFRSEEACLSADRLLSSFVSTLDQEPIFNVDNRGDSLFIELVYPSDIKENHSIKSKSNNKEIKDFKQYVSFVAIKNGEHNGDGYLTSNVPLQSADKIELTAVKDIIMQQVLS